MCYSTCLLSIDNGSIYFPKYCVYVATAALSSVICHPSSIIYPFITIPILISSFTTPILPLLLILLLLLLLLSAVGPAIHYPFSLLPLSFILENGKGKEGKARRKEGKRKEGKRKEKAILIMLVFKNPRTLNHGTHQSPR